jgi:hypothetical protein
VQQCHLQRTLRRPPAAAPAAAAATVRVLAGHPVAVLVLVAYELFACRRGDQALMVLRAPLTCHACAPAWITPDRVGARVAHRRQQRAQRGGPLPGVELRRAHLGDVRAEAAVHTGAATREVGGAPQLQTIGDAQHGAPVEKVGGGTSPLDAEEDAQVYHDPCVRGWCHNHGRPGRSIFGR